MSKYVEEDPKICLNCEKPVCDNCLEHRPTVRKKRVFTPEQLERHRAESREYYWKKKAREKKVV